MADKKETPSDKEIKDLLSIAKKGSEDKVDKSKERIVDKPAPKVDKSKPTNVGNAELLDTIKAMQKQLNTLDTKVNSLATNHKPEENKTTKETNQEGKEPTPEEKLALAKQQGQKDTGDATIEAVTNLQQSVGQIQQMQAQGGKITGQQIVYLIAEAIKAATAIVPAAMTSKGADSGGVASMIENFKTFGELSKVFSAIQTNIAKGYSDSLKVMTPPVRQEVAEQMLRGSSIVPAPGTPSAEGEEHIR